jgi:NAD-dependent DNA ligase
VARNLVTGSGTDAVVLSAGMQVCFTGTALVDGKRIQRKHLQAAAKRAGLVATEDVSSRTSVLVCPDVQAKPQGKFKKAIGYGIPVISVSAFMEQIPLDED